MTTVISQHTNNDTNMTGFVFISTLRPGTFGASLKDEDSGEFLGSFHGYETIEKAEAKAKFLAGI